MQKDSLNFIITYSTKEYLEDLKHKSFLTSSFFILYSILWALITNMKEKDEKANPEIDFSKLYIGKFTKDAVSYYHKEFQRITQDFNFFKNALMSLDTKNINIERLNLILDIMSGNNLFSANAKGTKIQRGILRFIDYLVEVKKFELGVAAHKVEIKAINKLIDNKRKEIERDEKIKLEFEVALKEQPQFLDQIVAKIEYDQQVVEDFITAKDRFTQISAALDSIVKANFELNNPCAANHDLYPEYIMATSLYITHCTKYTGDIRKHLFKLILNNLSSDLDMKKHKIHQVLHGETFFIDCLKRETPMSLTLIDNVAIFDLIMELNMLFPLIVDPTALFFKFLKSKLGRGLFIEINSIQDNTIQNVRAAISEGHTLCVVDFNKDLFSLIEPLLNWRYQQVVQKVFKKHVFTNISGESKQNDEEVIVMNEGEEVNFNGKMINIHPDFKLILILQNTSINISKFMLEKVFLINNDIDNETSWKEAVSDILL